MGDKAVQLARLIVWVVYLRAVRRLSQILRPRDPGRLDAILPIPASDEAAAPVQRTDDPSADLPMTADHGIPAPASGEPPKLLSSEPPADITVNAPPGVGNQALQAAWDKVEKAMNVHFWIMTTSFGVAIAGPVAILLSGAFGGLNPVAASKYAERVIYAGVIGAASSIFIPLVVGFRLKSTLKATHADWAPKRLEVGDLLTLIVTGYLLFSSYLGNSTLINALVIFMAVAVMTVGALALHSLYRMGSALVYLSRRPETRVARIAIQVANPSSLLAVVLAQDALANKIHPWRGTIYSGLDEFLLFAACLVAVIFIALMKTRGAVSIASPRKPANDSQA